jgi:hypothetical protein
MGDGRGCSFAHPAVVVVPGLTQALGKSRRPWWVGSGVFTWPRATDTAETVVASAGRALVHSMPLTCAQEVLPDCRASERASGSDNGTGVRRRRDASREKGAGPTCRYRCFYDSTFSTHEASSQLQNPQDNFTSPVLQPLIADPGLVLTQRASSDGLACLPVRPSHLLHITRIAPNTSPSPPHCFLLGTLVLPRLVLVLVPSPQTPHSSIISDLSPINPEIDCLASRPSKLNTSSLSVPAISHHRSA